MRTLLGAGETRIKIARVLTSLILLGKDKHEVVNPTIELYSKGCLLIFPGLAFSGELSQLASVKR